MWRLSWAHMKARMPRSRSSVTGLPSPPSAGPTHTLRTSLTGAIQPSRVPSGEMRAWTRSGLPNRTRRGISAGASAMHRDYDAATLRAEEAILAVSAYVLIQTEVGKAAQVAEQV